MGTICKEKNCHLCCNQTNMHLTQTDIIRITQHSPSTSFFTQTKDGCLQLKNHNGRCIFHDGTDCTIYPIRPTGCRLYPLAFDIDLQKAIYDSICSYPKSFPVTDEKIKQLHQLITMLFTEHNDRQKNSKKLGRS